MDIHDKFRRYVSMAHRDTSLEMEICKDLARMGLSISNHTPDIDLIHKICHKGQNFLKNNGHSSDYFDFFVFKSSTFHNRIEHKKVSQNSPRYKEEATDNSVICPFSIQDLNNVKVRFSYLFRIQRKTSEHNYLVCKNTLKINVYGYTDPYVEVTLYSYGIRGSNRRQKTCVSRIYFMDNFHVLMENIMGQNFYSDFDSNALFSIPPSTLP